MINLIEFRRLTECRKRLDNIQPTCSKELSERKKAKAILDDILEFKMFSDLPEFK